MTQQDMFETTPCGRIAVKSPRHQSIHPNSRKAYHEERQKLSGRSKEVMVVFTHLLRHLTDRQVMEAMGFTDMNAVRPRITELIDAGYLMEVGKVGCPVTGKTVRMVGVNAESEVSE